jgi:carbon starvation protein CstA
MTPTYSIGGAVHDIVVLFASMRKNGKTLSEVAKEELGPVAGGFFSSACSTTMDSPAIVIVMINSIERPVQKPATGLPIAMGVGLYYKKTGNLKLASTVGFLLLMAGVVIPTANVPHGFFSSACSTTMDSPAIVIVMINSIERPLKLASTVGFLLLMAGVVIGPWLQTTALGDMLTLGNLMAGLTKKTPAIKAAKTPIFIKLLK